LNKKKFSKILFIAALLIVACPFILEYIFHVRPNYILKSIGIRYVFDQYWFFVASGFLMVSCGLQFPLREEESWHCECGYDLSYMNRKSNKCPECSKKVQLEWSAQPGGYSRATTKRLHWSIFLFVGSLAVFGLGLLLNLFNS
jgi:hypothetical protein